MTPRKEAVEMDAVELDEACRVLAVWTLEFAAWGIGASLPLRLPGTL